MKKEEGAAAVITLRGTLAVFALSLTQSTGCRTLNETLSAYIHFRKEHKRDA
jgi:hypothetical protein